MVAGRVANKDTEANTGFDAWRSAILNEDLRGQDARAELHGGIYACLSSIVAGRVANKKPSRRRRASHRAGFICAGIHC